MRRVVTILSVTLVAAYPALVYLGISRFSVRTLGVVLLALLLPGQLLRMRGRKREHLAAVLPLFFGIVAILLVAMVFEDHRLILVLPVLINVALFVGFVSSLRGSTSLVERFALMQTDELSPPEVLYCRRVTIVWSIFFGCNALLILGLALFAPLSWWTLYAGGLVYVLMGLLFSGEYVYRKARFRRYGNGWHDRIFARYFPPDDTTMSRTGVSELDD